MIFSLKCLVLSWALKLTDTSWEFLCSNSRSKNEGKHHKVLILVDECPHCFSGDSCMKSKSRIFYLTRYKMPKLGFGNLVVLCLLLSLWHFRNCRKFSGGFSCSKSIIDKIIRSSNNNFSKSCHDLAQNMIQSAIFGHSWWGSHSQTATLGSYIPVRIFLEKRTKFCFPLL